MNEEYYLYNGKLVSRATLTEKYGEDGVDNAISKHGFDRAYQFNGKPVGESSLRKKYGDGFGDVISSKGITLYGTPAQPSPEKKSPSGSPSQGGLQGSQDGITAPSGGIEAPSEPLAGLGGVEAPEQRGRLGVIGQTARKEPAPASPFQEYERLSKERSSMQGVMSALSSKGGGDKFERQMLEREREKLLPGLQERKKVLDDEFKRNAESVDKEIQGFLKSIDAKDFISNSVVVGEYVPDTEKLEEKAREYARERGLPEDGFTSKMLWNKAKDHVAWEIIRPEVEGRFSERYKAKYGKTPKEDSEKIAGALGIQEEKVKREAELASFEQGQKEIAKESILKDVSEALGGLSPNQYMQSVEAERDAAMQNLNQTFAQNITPEGFVGDEQLFNAYNQQFEQIQRNAERTVNRLVEAEVKARSGAQRRYNRAVESKADELQRGFDSFLSQKEPLADKFVEDRVKSVWKEAYQDVVKEQQEGLVDPDGKLQFTWSGKQLDRGYFAEFALPYYSMLGGSIKAMGTTLGSRDMQVWGDFVENKYNIGSTEIEEWSDWFTDARLALRSMGSLAGSMTTSMVPALAVGAVTGGLGAGAVATSLAGGGAAFLGETVDLAGRMYDDTFSETGDAALASERAKKVFDSQIMLAPTYSLEMLPFFGKFSGGVFKRFLKGAGMEYATETFLQEFPQNAFEDAIKSDAELSEVYKYMTWDGLNKTAMNTVGVIPMGGGGQVMQAIKENPEQQQKRLDENAKSIVSKLKLGRVSDAQLQTDLLNIVANHGTPMADAVVASMLSSGEITYEQAGKLLSDVKAAEEFVKKASDLNLDSRDAYVFTNMRMKLREKERAAEADQDPLTKGIRQKEANKLKKDLEDIFEGKDSRYVTLTYPNNSFEVLTYDEARKKMKEAGFADAFNEGEVKLEAFGSEAQNITQELAEIIEGKPAEEPVAQEEIDAKTEKLKDGIAATPVEEVAAEKTKEQKEVEAITKKMEDEIAASNKSYEGVLPLPFPEGDLSKKKTPESEKNWFNEQTEEIEKQRAEAEDAIRKKYEEELQAKAPTETVEQAEEVAPAETLQPTPPTDAVQEQSTESVPVRQQPETRQGVREEDTQGQEAPQEGEAVQEEVTAEKPVVKTRPKLSELAADLESERQSGSVEGELLRMASMYNRIGKKKRRDVLGNKLMADMQNAAKNSGYQIRIGKTGRAIILDPNGKEVVRKRGYISPEEKAEMAKERREDKQYRRAVLNQQPVSVEHFFAMALADGKSRLNTAEMKELLGENYDIPSWMIAENGISIRPNEIAELIKNAGFGMDQEVEVSATDVENAIRFFADTDGRQKAFDMAESVYLESQSDQDARSGMTEQEAIEMYEQIERQKALLEGTEFYNALDAIDGLTEEQAKALEDEILAQEKYEASTQFIQDAERYATGDPTAVSVTEVSQTETQADDTGDAGRRVEVEKPKEGLTPKYKKGSTVADRFEEGLFATTVFEGGEVDFRNPKHRAAWRSMGPKEFMSILDGKKHGGIGQKKGAWFASFPKLSAQITGKNKFLVEYAGVIADDESSPIPLGREDITGVWKYDGKSWVKMSPSDVDSYYNAQKQPTKSSSELAKAIRDKKIQGTLFVDPLFGGVALTKAVYNGALELAARLVEQNTAVGKVIEEVVNYIEAAMKGKSFNRAALESDVKRRLWFVDPKAQPLYEGLKEYAQEYKESIGNRKPTVNGLHEFIRKQEPEWTRRDYTQDAFNAVFKAEAEGPAAPVTKPSGKATKEAVKEARAEERKKASEKIKNLRKSLNEKFKNFRKELRDGIKKERDIVRDVQSDMRKAVSESRIPFNNVQVSKISRLISEVSAKNIEDKTEELSTYLGKLISSNQKKEAIEAQRLMARKQAQDDKKLKQERKELVKEIADNLNIKKYGRKSQRTRKRQKITITNQSIEALRHLAETYAHLVPNMTMDELTLLDAMIEQVVTQGKIDRKAAEAFAKERRKQVKAMGDEMVQRKADMTFPISGREDVMNEIAPPMGVESGGNTVILSNGTILNATVEGRKLADTLPDEMFDNATLVIMPVPRMAEPSTGDILKSVSATAKRISGFIRSRMDFPRLVQAMASTVKDAEKLHETLILPLAIANEKVFKDRKFLHGKLDGLKDSVFGSKSKAISMLNKQTGINIESTDRGLQGYENITNDEAIYLYNQAKAAGSITKMIDAKMSVQSILDVIAHVNSDPKLKAYANGLVAIYEANLPNVNEALEAGGYIGIPRLPNKELKEGLMSMSGNQGATAIQDAKTELDQAQANLDNNIDPTEEAKLERAVERARKAYESAVSEVDALNIKREILEAVYGSIDNIPEFEEYSPRSVSGVDASVQGPNEFFSQTKYGTESAPTIVSNNLVERKTGGTLNLESAEDMMFKYIESMPNTAHKMQLYENYWTLFNNGSSVMTALERLYGRDFKEALQTLAFDSLTGKPGQLAGLGDKGMSDSMLQWLFYAASDIMFFNMRSALFQTISGPNFILDAITEYGLGSEYFAQAFNKNITKDRQEILESGEFFNRVKYTNDPLMRDMIEIRQKRGGNAAAKWIADKLRDAYNKGYTPTQWVDSNLTISYFGAPLYSALKEKFLKENLSQGMDEVNAVEQAKEKAMAEFWLNANMTQQSSLAMFRSVEQSSRSPFVRMLFTFGSVSLLYTRAMYETASDVFNGRRSLVNGMTRIAYYGAIQNIMFLAVQGGLVWLLGSDDGEDEERKKVLQSQKTVNMINGSVNSVLRGFGAYGAIFAVAKDFAVSEYLRELKKEDREAFDKDLAALEQITATGSRYENFLKKMVKAAPVLDIRVRDVSNALKAMYDDTSGNARGKADEVWKKIDAASKVLSATGLAPGSKTISRLIEGMMDVVYEDLTAMEAVGRITGVLSKYDLENMKPAAAATLSKSERELEKEMSGFKEKMIKKLYDKKGDNFLRYEDQANIGVSKSAYGDYTVSDYKNAFKDRYNQITTRNLPSIDKSGIRESHNATVLRNKDPKLSGHILSKDGEGVSVKNPVQVASSMHGAGIKELTDAQKELLRKFYGANKKGSELGKIESELKKLQSK